MKTLGQFDSHVKSQENVPFKVVFPLHFRNPIDSPWC